LIIIFFILNRAAHKYCIDPLKEYVAAEMTTTAQHIKVVNPLTSLKPDFLSDVVISCEGKDFSAHRAVLASKSIKLSYKFSKSLNL
jgi:hypothetical protein